MILLIKYFFILYRPNFIATITNEEFRDWAYGLNNLWRRFGKQVMSDVFLAIIKLNVNR